MGINLRVETDNPFASNVWMCSGIIRQSHQAARATQGGTHSMAVIEPCVGPLGWRPVNDILFSLNPIRVFDALLHFF